MATRKASMEFRHRRILKTLYFFQLRRMLHTADLNIAVAVEGKLRLEHLFPAAADINIRTRRIPIIFQHHRAFFSGILRQIRIKHLRIADDDLCARLLMQCNPRYTGHLLFQIVEIHTREQLFSRLCRSPVHNPHRRIVLTDIFRLLLMNRRPGPSKARHCAELFDHDGIHNNWLFPGAVIKLRQRISFVNLCPARIVLLSGKVAGKQVRTFSEILPILGICSKDLTAAVLVLHDNLGKQTLLVSKVIEVLHHKGLCLAPPARCQRHADSVSARFHQPCDIVCLIVHSVVILCQTRTQQIFRDLLSVDPAVVDTTRSNIKACRYQFFLFLAGNTRPQHWN